MKKLLLITAYLASAWLVAATQPLFENNAELNSCCTGYGSGGVIWDGCTVPPTIDAITFVNRSIFNVNCSSPAYPFEMLNLVFFTNTLSGRMYGLPGFRFDHFSGNTREMMYSWVNNGSITGETWLVVSSHYITNTGSLATGPSGLIRLSGDSISLARSGLRSGQSLNTTYYGGSTYSTNYENATGISDLYWGCGTNNYMNNQGTPMALISPNWDLPCSVSPQHQVIDGRYGTRYTNLVTVPEFQYGLPPSYCNVPYTAHVYTNQFGTTKHIQIVYIPTNNLDSSFSSEVRFYPNGQNGGADVVVAFQMIDYDLVDMSFNTNALYLVDHAAFMTNITLLRPYAGYGNGMRPSNYELFRYDPYAYYTTFSYGNSLFTNALIYNPAYFSNQVRMLYAGYAANLAGPIAAATGGGPGGTSDPTNFPGRIEVTGQTLNLEQTRIRAESTILLRAQDNLVNNKLARLDAPYLSFDLRSKQSPLYITNLAPSNVRRLSGDIYCWTGVWDNYETNEFGGTNLVKFHVLIVNSALQSLQPVSVFELIAHATNVVISDSISITRNVLLDSRDLLVQNALTFPPNSSWNVNSVPQLLNFTNVGVINVPLSSQYGTDRTTPYSNFINHGTNIAASQFIRTRNFENTGTIVASGGLLNIDVARTATFSGDPTVTFTNVFTNWFPDPTGWITNVYTNIFTNTVGSKLLANSDIEIRAHDMFVSNSVFIAGDATPGALIMSVTNNLSDSGTDVNQWVTKAGFRMLRQPATSSLLHTHITSKAPRFALVEHTWSAQDRGATNASGYSNNLALGKLTLDGDLQSQFHFSASGTSKKAMYIDYLELLNNAADHRNSLVIDPNLTIYIADANIAPRKLEETHPGRIFWVPYFVGPYSGTNVYYASVDRTYLCNRALVTDQALDSNQNGIPNYLDPEPLDVDANIGLVVTILPGQPLKAAFSWTAFANARSWLESQTPPASNWVTVTSLPASPVRTRISVTNTIPNDKLRFYRVRVDPPPLF